MQTTVIRRSKAAKPATKAQFICANSLDEDRVQMVKLYGGRAVAMAEVIADECGRFAPHIQWGHDQERSFVCETTEGQLISVEYRDTDFQVSPDSPSARQCSDDRDWSQQQDDMIILNRETIMSEGMITPAYTAEEIEKATFAFSLYEVHSTWPYKE